MSSSDVWDEETAASYDADTMSVSRPDVVNPVVDVLERFAATGRALEFGIGTGRIAIPLHQRGSDVAGVDLSPAMIRHLRSKISADQMPVTEGSMATVSVPGSFSVVYVVFNSIANLRTQDEQVECFLNAARHLEDGGRFVVELFVPPLRQLTPGATAVPFDVSEAHVGLDTFDLVSQECVSHHFTRQSDGRFHYGVGHFRYIWPAECDLMARLAGLELESRHADWIGTPFTAESARHVSVWRKPA